MPTYARLPVQFVEGRGARLWDEDGREYLDALSGIAVCNLGHAHPAVTEAVCDQAGKLVHTSNLYGIERQERLADRLAEHSGLEKMFFCNSGAEANEAAIKLARLYGHRRDVQSPAIVVMENSFHGRTLATLTATGNRKVQAGFEPLVQGFVRAPFDDVEALERIAENNPNVVAVLVEPIQGEGGVNMPDADYLREVRRVCDQHGWLMMLDEIQTGVGRTGRMFAHQHAGIRPDVMTLAKGLGNGIPIGACLAGAEAADVLGPGHHGTTFGGNPVACAAGQAVIDTMDGESIPARAAERGEAMLGAFRERLADEPLVRDIRGQGLMIGLELAAPCGELVGRALERGLLINVTAGNVIRLLPPLVIDESQAERIVDEVVGLIREFAAEQPAGSP